MSKANRTRDKKMVGLRLDNSTLELVERYKKKAGCRSAQEFNEKAVKYYVSQLAGNDAENYLEQVIDSSFRALFEQFSADWKKANEKLYIASAEMLMSIIMLENYDPDLMPTIHYAAMKAVKQYGGPITMNQAQKVLDESVGNRGEE